MSRTQAVGIRVKAQPSRPTIAEAPLPESEPARAVAHPPRRVGVLGGTFDPPHIHAGGPFSGRWGGEPSFEKWIPLGPMEELAWRTRIGNFKYPICTASARGTISGTISLFPNVFVDARCTYVNPHLGD